MTDLQQLFEPIRTQAFEAPLVGTDDLPGGTLPPQLVTSHFIHRRRKWVVGISVNH